MYREDRDIFNYNWTLPVVVIASTKQTKTYQGASRNEINNS